jgi:flagellar M-ring protein FliF
MSSAGLPNSGDSGYSLLDKEGVTTSQFKEQVDYQRAIEGELARTIESVKGVRDASVHLAIPKQNVFNDGSQQPTAAVLLTTERGSKLSNAQVQSVVNLVSSSVPDMDADSVTVSDSDGHVLAAPGEGVTGVDGSSKMAQASQAYDDRMSTSLESMINQVVGAGHSVVTVNADLDFSKTNTTKKSYSYDPDAPPVSEKKSSETYSGSQAGRGGPLGAGSPAATQADGSGNGNYSKNSSTVNNALGTVTKTTENAPVELNKLSIAVLIDSSAAEADTAAIKSLVTSAVGLNTKRGDTLAVKAMPFDDSAADDSENSPAEDASADAGHEYLVTLIKQGALAAVIVTIIVITIVDTRRRHKHDDEPPDDDLFGPELLDLPPAPEEPAQASADPDWTDLPRAADSDAAARRQALSSLADEQPDDVARVLSDWLNSKESSKS